MNAMVKFPETDRYARTIAASKAVHWEIETDVIKGRSFDLAKKYLPDGLSLVAEMTTLSPAEKRFMSQVQGRTYANIFGLVERFIGPETRVVAISTHNPLGVTFAAGVYTSIFGESKQPINSFYARQLFEKVKSSPHRRRFQVLVGGGLVPVVRPVARLGPGGQAHGSGPYDERGQHGGFQQNAHWYSPHVGALSKVLPIGPHLSTGTWPRSGHAGRRRGHSMAP